MSFQRSATLHASVRTALIILLLASLLHSASAGPATFDTESLSVALTGRYRYQPQNERSRRGTVEFRVQFALRPEGTKARACFGDTDYIVSSVTLILDGKPQKFPVELLQDFGFSVPDRIFLWGAADSTSVLMSGEFVAGIQRRGFLVRIRDGVVIQGPPNASP